MRRGYTLVEMLTTVAALVILLGLMVSLARYVRHRSAEEMTRQVLSRLNTLLHQYASVQDQLARATPPLVRGGQRDEASLHESAIENNRVFVKFFRDRTGGAAFGQLPWSVYDGVNLRDAWGTPIVFMAGGGEDLGISLRGRPFFFSAGPDRKFSTVLDNQYSYERAWENPAGQRE